MFSNKKLAVAVTGAVLLMAGQFALADSTTDIVDALVGKGVLTEEEGKLISKGHTSQKDKTPTVKEKDGAFILSSPNGKNSIQLTGRLHFDYRNSDINSYGTAGGNNFGSDYDRDSASTADHFLIRRARIGVKGRLGGIADYEVVGNLPGTATIDVAYLDINKYEPLGLKFGKFKQPYNLEEQTSSNNIDFVERSYINQNAPGKKLGAMLHGEFTGATYAASMFNMNDDATSSKDKDMSFAGRGTLNFAEIMGNKDMVLHVGVAGFDSEYQIAPALSNNTGDALNAAESRGTVFGFRSAGGGLSNIYRAQIAGTTVNTGFGFGSSSPTTSNVKAKALGLEGIVAYNNFKIQGEYSAADYKAQASGRSTDPVESIKADVDTAYIEALWLVTGEKYSDSYKKGAFGSIKPKSEFNFDSGSGYGAWELGVRYDMFDVTNTDHTGTGVSRFQGALVGGAGSNYDFNQTCKYVSGQNNADCNSNGGAHTYTYGIKWVMNPNMLIKANWAHTKFDNAFKPIDLKGNDTQKLVDSEDLIMIRGQYMF